MNNYVIDSNVFLSAFVPEDVLHRDSVKFWNKFTRKKFLNYLPRISWSEISSRFYQKTESYADLFEIQKKLENAPDIEIVELDESIWLTAEMIQYHCQLKTSDLLVAATAYEKEATLITWDKQLIKQASKVVPAMTPKEFYRMGET